MPHVTFVSLSGFRVREEEMAQLGMTLPGLRKRAQAIAALPPLGLLTLAGMTPEEWSMSLHEVNAVTDDLVEKIVTERPALVAISALTASILEAYSLSDRLRTEGIRTVLGGLHVTACPDEAAEHADAIVVGDGESVWLSLLRDVEGDETRQRYQSKTPFDLAEAPLPRFDLLGDFERPRYTLQATRGCPYSCDFCAASRLLGPFRTKPAERLAAELSAICEQDPRPFIELADDNTFARGGPHRELLETFEQSGARWFTEADWRIGENPQLLESLATAGCVQVLVGLESLVHTHEGMGAKRSNLTRMMDAVRAIQEAGVAVIGCYIVGSDGESPESLARLEEFLQDDPCADAQITLQTPFPGTALRERLQSEGRLLPDRDWSHHTLFDVTYLPDQLAPEELQTRFHELLSTAFGVGATERRMKLRRETWSRNPMFKKGRAR